MCAVCIFQALPWLRSSSLSLSSPPLLPDKEVGKVFDAKAPESKHVPLPEHPRQYRPPTAPYSVDDARLEVDIRPVVEVKSCQVHGCCKQLSASGDTEVGEGRGVKRDRRSVKRLKDIYAKSGATS